MKMPRVVATTLLALVGLASGTSAAPIRFDYSGAVAAYTLLGTGGAGGGSFESSAKLSFVLLAGKNTGSGYVLITPPGAGRGGTAWRLTSPAEPRPHCTTGG